MSMLGANRGGEGQESWGHRAGGVKSEQARRVHNKRDGERQPCCQEPSD